MKIHLFKIIYPSGYTRKGLTLTEAIRYMNKRNDLIFKNDKTVVL
jgi:hypothetical protein